MDEIIKERIKFYTELIKLLAGVFAGTLGGSIALIVKETVRGRELAIFTVGFLFSIFLLVLILTLSRTVKEYTDGDE